MAFASEAKVKGDLQRLTNADFRKLLMTSHSSIPSTLPTPSNTPSHDETLKQNEVDDRADRRRKKKSFYAKLRKEEDEKSAELAKKYRDRAFERRDSANTSSLQNDEMTITNGYRAVAPDVRTAKDQGARRRQLIHESKFLGGDMEHTHLVKGLDYALLQKVRCEIEAKEPDQKDEMEQLVVNKSKKEQAGKMEFKTTLGCRIYNAAFSSKIIKKNELFAPGRMAYSINLDNDLEESDIPTTIIRSRADCPGLDATVTLSINDFVIQKLAGIFSNLRSSAITNKKARKKDRVPIELKPQNFCDSIYEDIGEYKPAPSSYNSRAKPLYPNCSEPYGKGPNEGLPYDSKFKIANNKPDKEERVTIKKQQEIRSQLLLEKLTAEPQGYAECYPGLEEMHDAIDDSDDDVDYSKMDLGNKKGLMRRWDFDTQEEYGDYMSSKEALPKAAFQYGVKMVDGRRTRKHHKENNEKLELDREWLKIQSIIQKNKFVGTSEGSNFKRPKH